VIVPPDDALVKVEDVGDTQFLLEQQVDKFPLPRQKNERVSRRRQPHRRPLLLGITKSSALHRLGLFRRPRSGDHRVATDHLSRRGRPPARLKENCQLSDVLIPPHVLEYYRNVRLSPEMEEAAAKVQKKSLLLRRGRARARADAYGKLDEELAASKRASISEGAGCNPPLLFLYWISSPRRCYGRVALGLFAMTVPCIGAIQMGLEPSEGFTPNRVARVQVDEADKSGIPTGRSLSECDLTELHGLTEQILDRIASDTRINL